VGEHVGITIYEKSSAKVSVAMAALLYAVLAVTKFAYLTVCLRESCFYRKKSLKGIKDLKTVRSKGPKPKKQIIATKKPFTAGL
jgi:hypothetical protein